MMWILHGRGVHTALHYLDDFLVLGPPGQASCVELLSATLELCQELGFPVAEEKTEGPTTFITFLGIEIDTLRQQVRLQEEKLARLTSTIAGCRGQSIHPLGARLGREIISPSWASFTTQQQWSDLGEHSSITLLMQQGQCRRLSTGST